ncbi:MAG: hypothetical protein ACM3NR_03750 [Methanosarcina sp.]
MKKNIFTLVFLLSSPVIFSQAAEKKFEPSGKVLGTVFLNYHYDMTENVTKKSQIEILRSYLGYQYSFSEKITSKILLDISNDGKAFSAFLKNASLEWKISKTLALEGGMISTHIFDTQEKFYNTRYILETLQDKDKFYSSADLGVKATFKPFSFMELHAGFYNGDGYKKIQDDFGVQKASFDVVIMPVKGVTFKTYYDFMPKRDTAITNRDLLQTQSILNFFLGYELVNVFRAGIEYDMLGNSGNVGGRELNGISAFGSAMVGEKIELLVRYDQLTSNKMEDALDPWNINKDHRMILTGLQFSPVKGVRTALNYRHFLPEKDGSTPMNLLYLNLEYKF